MSAAKRKDLVLGGEPRVQLLPPSIALREKSRQARSLAVLAVILAIVVTGGGIMGASFVATTAKDALAQAQNETTSIQAQQAQFAPGAIAAANVEVAREALTVVTATEVDWKRLYSQLDDAMLNGVVLNTLTIEGRSPWQSTLVAEAPLRGARELALQLELTSAKYPVAADVYDRLAVYVDGFADAYLYSVEYDLSRERFVSKLELTLDTTLLWKRYAADLLEQLLTSPEVLRTAEERAKFAEAQREAREKLVDDGAAVAPTDPADGGDAVDDEATETEGAEQ